MDPARLKADAGAALAAGEFSRAASLYAAYCASAPRDRQSHLRLGDAWARAGDHPRAIDAYLAAAQGFAEDGFLARAIAASKRVLELDPKHTQMPRILADLYAKRAAGGQALRSLLHKGGEARDAALPVRPFAVPGAPAPARAVPRKAATEPTELLVSEYVLEADPQEQTLEDVLRTEADRRVMTPVPLGPPATAAPPTPVVPTPAPAPVPRFVELSLEDAGGEGLQLPPVPPRVGTKQDGADPGYIDLQLDEEPPPAPPPWTPGR